MSSNKLSQTVCRSCMESESTMLNMSDSNNLHEMFENCTGIKITEHDKLSTLLCMKCVDELQVADNFRNRSLQSNNLLLANLNSISVHYDDQNLPTGDTDCQINENSPTEAVVTEDSPTGTVVFGPEDKTKKGKTDRICHICNEKFPDAKQMTIHKRSHFYYKCRRCKVSYKTSEECERHKCTQTNLPGNENSSPVDCQRILKCHICYQELMHARSLVYHLRTHTGEKPCLCTMCGLKFREEKALINHTRAVHTKEKRFKCTFCPKAFPVSGKRREHERIHTGEKPYQCEQCLRLFGTRCALMAHTRRHTKQIIYTCNVQDCELGFYTYSSYQRHTWAHRGQRPYECDKCQKTYLSKQNLTSHQKSVHTKIKDQQCHICNKQFSEKSTLNRHLKSIHKTEPRDSKKPVPVYGFPDTSIKM